VLVFGKGRKLDQRDRITVHHAVTVLGLLLASRRAVVEAERRIAGDLLSDAFSGRLSGAGLARRLELVGFPSGARPCVIVLEAADLGDEALEDLERAFDDALGRRAAARTTVIRNRVAALVSHANPGELADAVVGELLSSPELKLAPESLAAGVGEPMSPGSVRDSYLSAVFAARATPPGSRVGLPADLGSYELLLRAQPRQVLEAFVGAVIGPLLERDRSKSSELVASVKAFVDAGGRWEQGSETLGVHRHTLRYRIRQAEQLLGKDLSGAPHRIEVWLALRAAEILDE
jgi:purine catabolism regulator